MKRKNTTPMRRRAVRAAAALISILMLLSSVTVLPVFAADTVSDYKVVPSQIYKDNELTGAYDVKTNGETIENVDVIANGNAFALLTETGLQTGVNATNSQAGVIVTTPTTGSFIIDMDMSMHNFGNDTTVSTDLRYTMEFGFSYNAQNNNWGTSNSYVNFAWTVNKDFSHNKNYYKTTTTTLATMWDHMIGAKDYQNDSCHYRFYVTEGKLVAWTISSGTDSITSRLQATTDACCDASTGKFAIRARYFSDYTGETGSYLNFTNISVVNTSTADTNRTMPTSSTTNYTDTADVNYTVGTVLHNMDFSKVDSFAETGYFVTKDCGNKSYVGITEEGTLAYTTGSAWSNLFITANEIPQNIQNYTISVRFRFLGGQNIDSRFQIAPGSVFKSGNVWYDANNSATPVAMRPYQNQLQNATTGALTHNDALKAGEWVTITTSIANGCVEKLEYAYESGKSETVIPTATTATVVGEGKYFAIRLATYTSIEISNIQFVAGTYDEQKASNKGLLFPEADNALVQTVKSPVVAKYVQQRTNESGLVDARFVSTVNFANLDAFAKIGYEITSIKINGTEYATDAITISDTQVFKTINAADKTYQAGEGDFAGCDYIFALELINFETEGTYEVTLTAFAEKENGARIYDYNGAVNITVTDGVVAVA